MKEMKEMGAKRSGEVGQGRKIYGKCYNRERAAEKGCYNVKAFSVMYLRIPGSLLSAEVGSRSRYPHPPISSSL